MDLYYNIKEAVENPQIEFRNMIVKCHIIIVIGKFKLAGNPIKMSNYEDEINYEAKYLTLDRAPR